MANHGRQESDILSDPPELDMEEVESYADIDEEEIPEWLLEMHEKFEDSSIPPYQPPRFQDGVPEQAVIDQLEAELGIVIRVVGVDTLEEEDWEIRVDGDTVGQIGRRRSSDGFTVLEISSAEFVEEILSTL